MLTLFASRRRGTLAFQRHRDRGARTAGSVVTSPDFLFNSVALLLTFSVRYDEVVSALRQGWGVPRSVSKQPLFFCGATD